MLTTKKAILEWWEERGKITKKTNDFADFHKKGFKGLSYFLQKHKH